MSNMGKTRLISLKLPCPCKATKGRPRISAVKKKLNLFLSTFYGDLMCSSLGACVCYEKKRDGSRVGSWRLDLVAKGASKLDGNDASLKEAVSSIKGKIEGVEYSGEFVRVIVLCNHVYPCPCK